MSADQSFHPPVRIPALINLIAILLLAAGGMFGLWQASRAEERPALLLYLLLTLLAFVLMPFVVYRLYALYRSEYHLARDGIRLQWGFRVEEIPMNRVLWAHRTEELEGELPMPRTRWPGSVVGVRHLADSSTVEFMASHTSGLVLISVDDGRYFAVSPANPNSFVETFHRFMELGSLTPLPARSVYPSFLMARFWQTLPARVLVLSGLALSFVLLAWVSLLVSSVPAVPLRLAADGSPLEMAPSIRLLLLPVLNALIFAADFLAGLFFFRSPEGKTLSFLLWGAGALTPLLFLTGVLLIQAAI